MPRISAAIGGFVQVRRRNRTGKNQPSKKPFAYRIILQGGFFVPDCGLAGLPRTLFPVS